MSDVTVHYLRCHSSQIYPHRQTRKDETGSVAVIITVLFNNAGGWIPPQYLKSVLIASSTCYKVIITTSNIITT
ncbi:hypothetical protein HmCmsJML035_04040 [Escherichia coli]|nr:hypothetical protein HmCmsJML035_04040 [Escherichia coli]GCY08490.1 hypothetical protein HmCmsJML077_03094 [Escherichia coli]